MNYRIFSRVSSGAINQTAITEWKSLPSDFAEKQMQGVMGFQVKVTRVEASFKLSQNRDDEDYSNVIQRLKERGDEQSLAIAEQMMKNRKI